MEDAADWRTHVQPDSRQRIVTKIMETLERQVPISGPDVLVELNKVAVRLEDTIFTIATSQTDYLRKISLKMLAMETKSQTNEGANSFTLNTGGGSQNPQDPASHRMQSQVRNPGQSQIPLKNQNEAQQQLLSQNIQNNIGNSGIHKPVALSSALPSGASLTQSSMPNAVNQGSNIQSGMTQNSSGNLVGQGGVASNMFANSTTQMQGWQLPQQTGSQQQQSQSSQQFWYPQQQLQQHLLKMDPPQQQLLGNISSSIMQAHMQQQQQKLTQLQSTQQPHMQMSSGLQPSQFTLQQTQHSVMQLSSGLQQNLQSSAAQSTPNVLQQHPQSVFRQPHEQSQQCMHQQAPVLHQQQQRVLPSQQHRQQKINAPNLQQHQLIGQQNNVSDLQQQQQQEQGSLNQQNNVANMPQHLLGNNICHQQHLGQQSNMSGLQKQQQQPIYTMHQQGGKAQQQQYAQVSTNMLQIQGQHAQSHPAQQQLMSQHPSQTMQMHQQLGLQHQPNSLQRDIQQRIQTSDGSMLNHQSLFDQKQVFHSQRPPPEASSKECQTSIVAAITGNTAATDKVHERKVLTRSLSHAPEDLSKMPTDKMIGFLNLPKSSAIPSLKDKLASYEKQILNILNSNRSWNPGLLQQQIQPTGGHAVSIQQQQQQQQQHQQLQQQQHQQLQQQQHQLPSSTSIDAAITGNATATGNAADQEEVYQTIKSMREKYLPDLSYMHQRISQKCHQHDSLPHPPKSEQHERLQIFKNMLDRMIGFLNLPKSSMIPSLKDKLALYEKQILNILNSNGPRKSDPVQQQIQPTGGHSLSIRQRQLQQQQQEEEQPQQQQLQQQNQPQQQQQQQIQSENPLLQQYENQMNSHMQPTILQNSVLSTQPTAATSMNHGSLPPNHVGVSMAQSNLLNSLQPGSIMMSGQGNNSVSLQLFCVGSALQYQSAGNALQQGNLNTMSQNIVNGLQSNVNSLQMNPDMLQQHPHLNQQLQQQQRQMYLHNQEQQQFHQLVHSSSSPGSVLQQMREDLKFRQGMGYKEGMSEQHLAVAGLRVPYNHQVKLGSSFPISSPQMLSVASPQLSQHSPQIDQQSLSSSLTKTGTPLQSANPPLIVPSPSTPLAPSLIPGDPEKQTSGVSSLSNAGNVGEAHSTASLGQVQSLAIGTPGISASLFLTEFTGLDGNQVTSSTITKPSATEQPLECLLKEVKSTSPKAFSASASDFGSVSSMIDRIAGSAPGIGSEASVGEDFVTMTKSHIQARNFIQQDGSSATKKMKLHTTAVPLNAMSSAGSVNDSFKQLVGMELSDVESTATSGMKRPRVEV
ncbi:hypothetical protein MKW98_014505 [Papaver atlanticum]|uniref:Mediator complex subunit 15 KIX domain-containing protein n=1 Tax=Papaver atlanticum TaxID=357466 RepID=A0AAD4XFU4_9MAGN|nr:hypothetical protein MKW98_014505 [Papaver atlanticum]